MKRYKIVEKDNVFTLYERNDYFILGLKLLPIWLILMAGIALPDDRIALICFILGSMVGGYSISLLVTFPYRKKEMFLDEEKMHQYIAEQKLLDNKPTVYYLD